MMWPARRGGDRFGDGAGSGGARPPQLLSKYLCYAMLCWLLLGSVLCAKYLAVNATHSAAQQMAESEWEETSGSRDMYVCNRSNYNYLLPYSKTLLCPSED